jgi:Rrf2 family protein
VRLELTKRGDYAVRAMIALTDNRDGLISGSRIAAAMNIPRLFVAQVMGDLVRAGLVEARNGRAGGYRLARRPDQISILQVIEAVEGETRRRTCVLRSTSCDPAHPCAVHDVFMAAQEALIERLESATLATAAATAAEQRAAAAQ